MSETSHDTVRRAVRDAYAGVAKTQTGEAPPTSSSPCCGSAGPALDEMARGLGYSDADLAAVPEGSNMGLGCGNPTAIAALKPGETVLDLGSGGGFDCFLAAGQVGPEGRVIGVDMTPEMISTARENAVKTGNANVEFRLGEIEHLPVADNSVDVAISNCVINLSPDKPAVFNEIFRTLKPGGRVSISDVVAKQTLPAALANDLGMVAGCVGGAATTREIETWLAAAGFTDIRITTKTEVEAVLEEWAPGQNANDYIASVTIEAVKP